MKKYDLTIPARDAYSLAATQFTAPVSNKGVVIINSAMATPRHFYRHLAKALANAGFTTLTWDYRGIGDSAPKNLRGFDAPMRDWVLKDMTGVVDWARQALSPERLFLFGHSAGGQLAGLLDNSAHVDGMITISAQSGHWRLQGGAQKWAVLVHTHLTLPLLSHVFGYLPWRKLMGGEDVPKGVALEWTRWCRNRRYILGDETLPLERYAQFTSPVLAYSIEDDDWGTSGGVDAMMRAYPNLERRHIDPERYGGRSIGHFGFFREGSDALWQECIEWLAAH